MHPSQNFSLNHINSLKVAQWLPMRIAPKWVKFAPRPINIGYDHRWAFGLLVISSSSWWVPFSNFLQWMHINLDSKKILMLILFYYWFILRERERGRESMCAHTSTKGAERETERQNPKQAPQCHCRAWCNAWTHEPQDRDMSQNEESAAYATEPPRGAMRMLFKSYHISINNYMLFLSAGRIQALSYHHCIFSCNPCGPNISPRWLDKPSETLWLVHILEGK